MGLEYLDWEVCLELFKALTPFILALIVYLVWHKQKEKEVIASEAKNSMLTANEILALLNDVISNFKGLNLNQLNDEDKKNLKTVIQEKCDLLNRRKNDLSYSIVFIADAKRDPNFLNIVTKNNQQLTLDLYNLERLMIISASKVAYGEEPAEELNVKILTYRRSIIDSVYAMKKILVGYALYRK